MNGYRKENKYIVSEDVLIDAGNRISGLMRPDEHQNGDFYKIRSIYFDSPTYRCYCENLAGVSTREKYRIRTYDCNENLIHAEIKIRHRETISKMNAEIDRDLFDALISGSRVEATRRLSLEINKNENNHRTLEKYLTCIATESFSPAVMVDYERSAFVYDICNVRITFDRNVFASREYTRMFDKTLTGRPALDDNMHILEIKYDEFLPDEIKEVLGGLNLNRTSSSKYAMCLERFI